MSFAALTAVADAHTQLAAAYRALAAEQIVAQPAPSAPVSLWGSPKWSDEFSGTSITASETAGWALYNSAGHAGNGLRRPSQVSVANGVMTQTGTADGLSAGMMLKGHDERRGRWEVRMRALQTNTGGHPYHAVLALLPQGVDYNYGERDIDFAEANIDEKVWLFAHYPPFRQAYMQASVTLGDWHVYAVEITNDHFTWFIDGVAMATIRNTAALPTTPMAVNVQLDAFYPSGLNPAQLQIDYVRFYAMPVGVTIPIPNATEPPNAYYNH